MKDVLSTEERLCSIHKTTRDHWVRCHRCQGHGTVMDYDDLDDVRTEVNCPDCGGHGGYEECEFCLEEDQLL
jgi:DnaJ-class molecular chaperone